MADLRLKSIVMRNWMTVKSASIDFPEKGLVLVIGSNLAAEGAFQSIGSGKTALGEALSRAVVGVNGRFSNLGHYSTEGSKGDTYVKVEGVLLDEPLTIEMGYRCDELSRTGEGLRFKHGARETIQRGHVDRTREELCKMLGVTAELANWTVFLDGDKLKFNRMSQEDSVNLLMTALAQPPWTDYHEKANARLLAANQQITSSKQALTAAHMRLERAATDCEEAEEDYKDAKEEYEEELEEHKASMQRLKDRLTANKTKKEKLDKEVKKLQKQLKVLEDQNAATNHAREIKRQELRDELAELDVEWLAASDARSTLNSELEGKRSKRSQMLRAPKNCPECNKPWDKVHSEQELQAAQQQIDEAQDKLNQAKFAFGRLDKKRKEINNGILAIEEEMRTKGHVEDTTAIAEKLEEIEREKTRLTSLIHSDELADAAQGKGPSTSVVDEKKATLKERKRVYKQRQTEVDQAAADLAADTEVLKIVRYWQKAFSPVGIPNMILSKAIPPLNRVARRISGAMTGGTLSVTYSTTSTLASGNTRPKLVTQVTNRIGSKRLEGSSKGEAGLTNLIIAENLNEIGRVSNRAGFRWYDEITSGQDSVVRRSIFSYLKDMAQQLGILIFVVDHHVEAAGYADYVLVAEKTIGEGTRYYWR